MNETTQSIPFIDWIGKHFSIIVPAIIASIAGVFALSRRYRDSVEQKLEDSRMSIDGELAKVWSEMRNHISVQTVQGSDIAVLKAEQRNTTQQLEDIKKTTNATNLKIDGLADKITTVLVEMRRERT